MITAVLSSHVSSLHARQLYPLPLSRFLSFSLIYYAYDIKHSLHLKFKQTHPSHTVRLSVFLKPPTALGRRPENQSPGQAEVRKDFADIKDRTLRSLVRPCL